MQKSCRICGKTFESCSTVFDSVLGNWKQFCCCVDPCAQTYYSKIMESRTPKETAKQLQDFNNEPLLKQEKIEDVVKSEEIKKEETPSYRRRRN